MNRFQLLVTVYLLSFIIVLAGVFVKILHLASGEPLLIAGLIATLIFIILVLQEVWRSDRLNTAEKLMWTAGLLLFNTITGIVYLLVGRKKVVAG